MKISFAFLFFCLFFAPLQAQNLWSNVYPQAIPAIMSTSGTNGIALAPCLDGGFICAVATSTSTTDSTYLFKVDSLGNFLWTVNLPDFKLPISLLHKGKTLVTFNNGKIFVAGMNNTLHKPELRSLDSNGNLVWTQVLSSSTGYEFSTLVEAKDGMLTALVRGLEPHLIKMDTTNGTIIWDFDFTTFSTSGFTYDLAYTCSIAQDTAGNYFLPGSNSAIFGGRTLWTISASGQYIDSVSISAIYPTVEEIAYTQDGNLLISATDNGTNPQIELIKVSPTGATLWIQYPPDVDGSSVYGLQELSNGNIIYCGFVQSAADLAGITCLDAMGNLKWQKTISYSVPNPLGFCVKATDIVIINDNDFVCTGPYIFTNGTTNYGYPFITRTDSSQATHFEQANITSYPDYNLNCTQDMNEYFPINNLLYQVTDNATGLPYYGFSGGLNNSSNIYLPSGGSYTLSLCPQDTNEWMLGCGVDTFQVVAGSATYLSLPLDAKYLCPRSTIDVSSPFLQPGFNADVYVYYCNQGTITDSNTQIVITLDTFLTYNNATIPLASINGQTLTFATGNLAAGECRQFAINCNVSATAPIGMWHCNTAHITPDTLCGVYWTGAVLNLHGYCQNDTFHYLISNTGTNMSSISTSRFYANNALVRTDNFQLLQGQSTEIIIPNSYNAGFYRMEVNQAIGFPTLLGDTIAAKNLMPCNGTATNNWGAWAWYNDYSGQTSTDVSYTQNLGSFDPNDKTVIPAGVGNQHITAKNGKMEYVVRFQNTGTTAATNVIVLDTLDTDLELNSLEILNASHPFVMDILQERVLRFSFLDIMLPDSGANEAASHGFFKYSVRQNPNLADGIELHNKAAIYFDFNAPIFTNDAWHTIGDPSIVAIAPRHNTEKNTLQLIPNPMDESAEIRWDGRDNQSEYLISLYDISGKIMKDETLKQPFMLYRKDLTAGVYIVSVRDNKGNYVGNLRILVR